MVTQSVRTAERRSMSTPALMLRVEGLALFAAAVTLYWWSGFGWWAFGLLLLAPDLAMVGYAVNKQLGSLTYNLAHTTVAPLALTVFGLVAAQPLALQAGLIWLAHIGMDRTVGYGLKYSSNFKDTHLDRV